MKPSTTTNRHRRVRPAKGRTRRGAATVEFAVVAAVFFSVVFACIEFSRVNMMRNIMQDAAYFAARRAMVPGAVKQDAITEANRILNTIGVKGATVTVNGGVELSRTTSQVSVTVNIPLSQNGMRMPVLKQKNLTTTAVMKTERYDKFYDGSI